MRLAKQRTTIGSLLARIAVIIAWKCLSTTVFCFLEVLFSPGRANEEPPKKVRFTFYDMWPYHRMRRAAAPDPGDRHLERRGDRPERSWRHAGIWCRAHDQLRLWRYLCAHHSAGCGGGAR